MADDSRQSPSSLTSREIPRPKDKEDKIYEEISGRIPKTGISTAEITKLFRGRVNDKERFADWLCTYYKYDDNASLFFPRKES